MRPSSLKVTSAIVLVAFSVSMAGCATNAVNANYAAQIEAYAAAERARTEVFKEQARAEEARFIALQKIAETGDPSTRALAVMALAMGGRSTPVQLPSPVAPPAPPESDADRAYKWAALFVGPVTNIAAGYFGYRLGVTQSNNNADTTIASYNAFTGIAQSGITGLTALGTAGLNANVGIAGLIQAPQPNITLGGNGVIGNGFYSTTTTTTTTTDSNNVNRECQGGNAGSGGSAGTTPGGAGGPGGSGGSATC